MFQVSHFGLACRASAIAIALKVAFFRGVYNAVGVGHALSHLLLGRTNVLSVWFHGEYLFKFLVLFRFSKSAFCLSTSPKAPCWRFPILAMTMFEQARHCSFGLTKTFFFVSQKVRFLAMTMFEQARRCSFGLTKTFMLCVTPPSTRRHQPTLT